MDDSFKRCSKCGRKHLPQVYQCDCGNNLTVEPTVEQTRGEVSESLRSTERGPVLMAKLSWILPLSAWASQAFSRILLASWAPAEVHLVLMILQGVAILGGFILAIIALIFMLKRKNWDGRGHAIAGCFLSGGTIVLNVWAFIG